MFVQTKRAIDKLKKSGLSRDEFKVNTERNYIGRHPKTGKQMFEYGEARIVLYASLDKIMSLTKNLLEQGLTVTFVLWEDERKNKKIGMPLVKDNGKGQLLLWNTLKTDNNPLGEIYPIKNVPKM